MNELAAVANPRLIPEAISFALQILVRKILLEIAATNYQYDLSHVAAGFTFNRAICLLNREYIGYN